MQHPKKFKNQHYAGSIYKYISVFRSCYTNLRKQIRIKKKKKKTIKAKRLLVFTENNYEYSNSEHESGSTSENRGK
jgi:hypothetical protein